MDCFFAAVEIRDDPSLRGKPVVVGGDPNSRGVVSTASYEARKYGIKSAMASAHALRLCPHAVFIRGSFTKYREASAKIREIFAQYTHLIEPVSIDEAYLDVTDNPNFKYASQIAKHIQQDIWQKTKLTGSAGVAPNKMVAKIASDMNKPNGLTVVMPHQVQDFMANLPLRKISGVGPASEKQLSRIGLTLCSDVWSWDPKDLKEQLGDRMGDWILRRSRGIDRRPIQTNRLRKSLGTERTFSKDKSDVEDLRSILHHLSEEVSLGLQEKNLSGRTITVKIKYADFQQITRARSLDGRMNDKETIYHIAKDLLGPKPAAEKPIRLLGITVSGFEDKEIRPTKKEEWMHRQISFHFLNS